MSFIDIIKKICEKLDIKCTVLSKGWVIMLEKGTTKRFISGYKFSLNDHAIGEIIDDKFAMYEVMKSLGIEVIEHNIMFRPDNKSEYAKNSNSYNYAIEYFKSHNNNIVIKQNDGTCGSQVYHITKEEDIIPCLDEIFIENFSISICPYYEIIKEYRIIVLDGKCMLSYGKQRAVVTGDGKKTIRELFTIFNPYYFTNKLKEDKYSCVLNKNEVFEYDWRNNLSRGAKPEIIQDSNLNEKLIDLALKTAKNLNLKFGSIDIIQTNEKLYVLEANSGIMMEGYMNIADDGYITATNIYEEAIKKMFE